ncbi:SusC/RagA family TonB-linked outer membrane protein [Chryseobacterium sp. PMSZPI]|uniref:SusC/RagA family TonB-linked outer membrane protein n=1 Tax=Chryseobacterium sp. PMSZPI TaxID=1033900 RepID=UPI000C34135F|nr:SusC/RagA family TonB-linked outer membrane protein [Chryseobacterium sp. PMSZPI]PKF74082.1 SusC/RagA family TonB-linked outer membrane protein [Chryseobacterium sp. PMSZPI]
MNVKLSVLSAGALFFIGQTAWAQKVKKDTVLQENKIDEVVVTGYQKKAKDEIAQAQSTITADELKTQTPTTSVGNMLQGRASGVFVQSRNGQPGSTAEINIRGISGFSGNSEPLYVVDGIYMTARQFNAVNGNDVENMVVLKDAAATAQYGSRGANGVVVVTTKKGRNGRTQYSFENRLGFSQKISDKELNFEMMNSAQKLQYEREMRALGLSGLPNYTANQEQELLKLDHNWQKDILRTSFLQSYLFSARGGSEKNKFYYSLGYDKDNGIVRDINGLDRYTGRFNFENNLSDKLKVGLDLGIAYQYTQNVRDRNNAQSPFGSMYRYNPFESVYNPDGSYNYNLRQGFNIIEALRNNLDYEQRLRLTGNVFGEYKINKNLSYRMYFNTLYDNLVNTNNLKRGSQLDVIVNGAAGLGTLRKTTFYSFNYIYGNRIDFKKQFEDHFISATGVVEFNSEFTENIAASGTNYKNPNSDAPSNTIPSDKNTFTGDKVKSTLFSLLGLFEYNYKKKYLITGSIRQDKSSKFGANNKSGIFWSGSLAWNIAKEEFLNGGFFNELKLRGSYGTVGNDRSIPNFANVGYVSYGDYGTGATMTPTTIAGNPDIKWETNKTTDLGIDFAFLNNRFRGAIEVYRADRNDFIQLLPLPYESGNYSVYRNLGDMRNEGLETEFTFDVIRKKNLKLSLRGNSTWQRSKITSLDGVSTQRNLGETSLKVGETPYFYRLVEYAGVNPADGKALYYTDRATPDAGENFYTINGRTATDVYNATADIKDLTNKSPIPKFFGGFGFTLEAYGFDLSADFSFKTGAYTYNYQTKILQSASSRTNNMSTDAFNYWKNPGDTNVLPKPTAVGLRDSDQFLEKSDYLRFRTLMVGYTFSKQTLGESIPVNSIRVYVQGQNLLTWTSFKGDPEVAVGSGENQLGVSQTYVSGSYALFSYPAVRQFMFGVQVEF